MKKGPLSTSKYYLLILAAPNLTRIFLINGAIKESHLFFRSKFLSQTLKNSEVIFEKFDFFEDRESKFDFIILQVFESNCDKNSDQKKQMTIYSSYFYIKIRTHSMIFFTVY